MRCKICALMTQKLFRSGGELIGFNHSLHPSGYARQQTTSSWCLIRHIVSRCHWRRCLSWASFPLTQALCLWSGCADKRKVVCVLFEQKRTDLHHVSFFILSYSSFIRLLNWTSKGICKTFVFPTLTLTFSWGRQLVQIWSAALQEIIPWMCVKEDEDNLNLIMLSCHKWILQENYSTMQVKVGVGWFVKRITQKLLYGFPQKLFGGWVFAQNRAYQL